VDTQARRLQNRPQVSDRRALGVGSGDVNNRRQLAFGVPEPLQQPMHPFKIEIDAFGMQGGQPRDQFAERRWFCRGRVHAWGAGGATSAAGTIWAALAGCGASFEAVSIAGDLVNSRQSRASVGRRS